MDIGWHVSFPAMLSFMRRSPASESVETRMSDSSPALAATTTKGEKLGFKLANGVSTRCRGPLAGLIRWSLVLANWPTRFPIRNGTRLEICQQHLEFTMVTGGWGTAA